MNKRSLLILICLSISISAQAKTYLCIDKQGNNTYSEQPIGKNCQILNQIGGNFVITHTPPIDNSIVDSDSSANDQAKPDKVKTAQRNLAEAEKALEEGKKVRLGNERNYVKYQERIQKLEEAVKTRQKELDEVN